LTASEEDRRAPLRSATRGEQRSRLILHSIAASVANRYGLFFAASRLDARKNPHAAIVVRLIPFKLAHTHKALAQNNKACRRSPSHLSVAGAWWVRAPRQTHRD
jgi:hypothetical protein